MKHQKQSLDQATTADVLNSDETIFSPTPFNSHPCIVESEPAKCFSGDLTARIETLSRLNMKHVGKRVDIFIYFVDLKKYFSPIRVSIENLFAHISSIFNIF